MKCPFCENLETSVVDSRDTEEGRITRRRRECTSCKARFTTYERPELANILVQKRDGGNENYDREKIESGIKKACEKRPVGGEKIREVADTIESKIFARNKDLISSKEIGLMVIEELKKVDEVAYLRFVSVYRSFGSLESFNKEIKKLKQKDAKSIGKDIANSASA